MSNENSIESQHKGVMATSESSIQKLSDQFENSRHDSYDSGTTSNDCFSPCVIAQWVKRIKEENSPFHERDTIEHVIVPILHCLGYDVNSPSKCCLVRDNNDSRSCKQNWDLNLFNAPDYADMSKLSVVIEAKSAKADFSGKNWCPKFSKDKKTLAILDKVSALLRDESGDDANDDTIKSLKEYIMRNQPFSKIRDFKSLVSGVKDKLLVFLEANPLPDLVSDSFKRLSKKAKFIVCRICTKRSNPTDDYFGQIWRYCMDGKHAFNLETTKVVWTNGTEWILFKKAFYDFKTPPKIVWDFKVKDFDNATKEKYLAYYKLPELNMDDNGFDLKWNEELEKLKKEIGPNGQTNTGCSESTGTETSTSEKSVE